MVAVPELPHELLDMALVLQRGPDKDLFLCPSADECSLRLWLIRLLTTVVNCRCSESSPGG